MKGKRSGGCVAIIGIVLLLAGLWMLKKFPQSEGVLQVLPYLGIWIGAGRFGQGMGGLVQHQVLKGHPELTHQKEIEEKDERNVMIASCSKAKAFDLMTFVYGALMLAFALMQIDLAAVLLLVAAYLFVEGYAIYCRLRMEREM